MSKDAVVGKTYEEVTHKENKYLKLEDEVMDDIFVRIKGKNYTILGKIIDDYYEDVSLQTKEIIDLSKEITDFSRKEKPRLETKDCLISLRKMCEDSLKKALKIFFLAD